MLWNAPLWPSAVLSFSEIQAYLQYGLVVFILGLTALFIWWITGRPPLSYRVWLVTLRSVLHTRVVQVIHANMNYDGRTADGEGTPSRHGEEVLSTATAEGEHANVIVVETPSTITSAPGSDTESGSNFQFELPNRSGGEEEDNIGEVHQFLRTMGIDNSAATAATIALYNRHLSGENRGNRLLISRLSMSVESESAPTQLISYDNMQAVAGTEGPPHAVELHNSETNPRVASSSSPATDRDASEPNTLNNAVQEATSHDASSIRLKFLDDTDMAVSARLSSTVGEFKRCHFAESIASGKVIRLIFKGNLLRDDTRSLASYGLHDQCVLHCHVGNCPYASQQQQQRGQPPSSEDISRNDMHVLRAHRPRLLTPISHILHSRIYWLDLLLVALWNTGFVGLWNWVQSDEAEGETLGDTRGENVGPVTEDGARRRSWPFATRIRRAARRTLRILFSCLFDPTAHSAVGAPQDENQFNPGIFLGFFFAVKFIGLWLIFFYFPNVVDSTGVFLLSMLTAFATLYFYFNRATMGQVPLRLA